MAYVKVLLLPLSLVYGIIIEFRNVLFHVGILKSRNFSVPVICVGNITVGGTGKTPHTEMIIAELKRNSGLPASAGDIDVKHPDSCWLH